MWAMPLSKGQDEGFRADGWGKVVHGGGEVVRLATQQDEVGKSC